MDPVTGLSLGRIAIGAAALASPAFSTKMFRLDGTSNPQLAYMVRMFGSGGRARRAHPRPGARPDAASSPPGSRWTSPTPSRGARQRDGSVARRPAPSSPLRPWPRSRPVATTDVTTPPLLSTEQCLAAIEHHSAALAQAARRDLSARVNLPCDWDVADLVGT